MAEIRSGQRAWLILVETSDGPHGKYADGHPFPRIQRILLHRRPRPGHSFRFLSSHFMGRTSKVRSMRTSEHGERIDFRTENSTYGLYSEPDWIEWASQWADDEH